MRLILSAERMLQVLHKGCLVSWKDLDSQRFLGIISTYLGTDNWKFGASLNFLSTRIEGASQATLTCRRAFEKQYEFLWYYADTTDTAHKSLLIHSIHTCYTQPTIRCRDNLY